MSEKFRAALFDFDGPFINTFEYAHEAHNATAQLLGLDTPSIARFQEAFGLEWTEYLNALWPGIDVLQFENAYRELGLKRRITPLIEGVMEILQWLLDHQYFLGLITNRDGESLRNKAKESGLDLSLFHFIQSADKAPAHKPDPRVFEPVLCVLDAKGITLEESFYVGDTACDLKAAKGAGLHFFGVLTGPLQCHDDWSKFELGKDNVLTSIGQLREVLALPQH